MRVEGRRIEEKQRPQDDGTWKRKRVGLKKKKNKVGNENEKTSRVTFPKRYFFSSSSSSSLADIRGQVEETDQELNSGQRRFFVIRSCEKRKRQAKRHERMRGERIHTHTNDREKERENKRRREMGRAGQ
jgi:hypothetical protein